jgi:uncharacterized protein (DUF736 family)
VNYDNTNSGALFKNDKGGNEQRPDYKGTLNVNGQEYWISAWLKSSKAGQKYMSLSVQPKEARQSVAPRQATAQQYRDAKDGGYRQSAPVAQFVDDDIPF